MPGQPEAAALDPESVLAYAEEVSGLFQIQLERGLFCGKEADPRGDQVTEMLVAAYLHLRDGRTEAAFRDLVKTERILLDAYHLQSKNWRFLHRYQPFLVLYYVLFATYLFVLGGNLLQGIALPSFLVVPQGIWGIPIDVLAFGASGAILRGLYWMTFKVGRREFRPHFQLAYYVGPWIGALFGALVYIVIRAGLWTFQGNDDLTQQPWGILGLAALSGYSWEWVTTWLDRIMNRVLGEAKEAGSAQIQQPPPSPQQGPETPLPKAIEIMPSQPSGETIPVAPIEELPEQPVDDDFPDQSSGKESL